MPDACMRCCIATKRENGTLGGWDATSLILVDTTDLHSMEVRLQELPEETRVEETMLVLPKEELLGILNIPLSEFS